MSRNISRLFAMLTVFTVGRLSAIMQDKIGQRVGEAVALALSMGQRYWYSLRDMEMRGCYGCRGMGNAGTDTICGT